MSKNLLSGYFEGVVAKRLSAVEADRSRSNQHEFNGTVEMKKLFGAERIEKVPTLFVWLDEEDRAIPETGILSWYDARENHPTRSEYRLYFSNTEVSEMFSEDDSVFIAKRPNGDFMVIATRAFSTMENQLVWLFGLYRKREGENHRLIISFLV